MRALGRMVSWWTASSASFGLSVGFLLAPLRGPAIIADCPATTYPTACHAAAGAVLVGIQVAGIGFALLGGALLLVALRARLTPDAAPT